PSDEEDVRGPSVVHADTDDLDRPAIRADGRPHVTPLIGVWRAAAWHFCTGPDEQKARNLAHDQRCLVTTGCNHLRDGLDLVIEGTAERVTVDEELERLAAAYVTKYGPDWLFDVRDGAFHHEMGEAHVFGIRPAVAFGFAKAPYSQTRWTFGAE
ncbi:MAG TPA: pyridoxamine 5'-phosphate oxidase family protein, partial [Ilumatobacteraceae bacterium]